MVGMSRGRQGAVVKVKEDSVELNMNRETTPAVDPVLRQALNNDPKTFGDCPSSNRRCWRRGILMGCM